VWRHGNDLYEFKGGTGTASGKVVDPSGTYVLGVLVQANFGRRSQLLVGGTPWVARFRKSRHMPHWRTDVGSIIVVAATNAPMLPHQLKRLARRVSMGIARKYNSFTP
jgi:D-aminopeptidase